jgi:hypothetical protein
MPSNRELSFELMKMHGHTRVGYLVGGVEGEGVGLDVGNVGLFVGLGEGTTDGVELGLGVGFTDGKALGIGVGNKDGIGLGIGLGRRVGPSDGRGVGILLGGIVSIHCIWTNTV